MCAWTEDARQNLLLFYSFGQCFTDHYYLQRSKVLKQTNAVSLL
jgi:hypothetical protein